VFITATGGILSQRTTLLASRKKVAGPWHSFARKIAYLDRRAQMELIFPNRIAFRLASRRLACINDCRRPAAPGAADLHRAGNLRRPAIRHQRLELREHHARAWN